MKYGIYDERKSAGDYGDLAESPVLTGQTCKHTFDKPTGQTHRGAHGKAIAPGPIPLSRGLFYGVTNKSGQSRQSILQREKSTHQDDRRGRHEQETRHMSDKNKKTTGCEKLMS